MNEKDRTHYKVLKVKSNASLDEIRSSYRNRVLETHPDRIPGREDEFRRVTEAFKILSDEGQREEYDQSLASLRKSSRQENTFKVANPSRLRNYVGTTQGSSAQPSSAGIGGFPGSSTVDDERAYFRARLRPAAPETKAEFEQRVKARAAPVVKIRSGSSVPLVLGGVLVTITAIYSFMK